MKAFAEFSTAENPEKHIEMMETDDFERLDAEEGEAVFLMNNYRKGTEEEQSQILARVANIIASRFEFGRQKEAQIREVSANHKAPTYAKAMVQGFFERMMLKGVPAYMIQDLFPYLMGYRNFEDFNEVVKGCVTGAQSVCDYIKHEHEINPDETLATHLEVDVNHKIDAFKVGVNPEGRKIITFVQVKSSEQSPDKLAMIKKAHQEYLSKRVKAERVINTEQTGEFINSNAEIQQKFKDILLLLSNTNVAQIEFDKLLRQKSKELGLSPVFFSSVHRLGEGRLRDVYSVCGIDFDKNQPLVSAFRSFTESPFETNKFHSTQFPDSILNGFKYYSQVVIGSKHAYEPIELDPTLWVD